MEIVLLLLYRRKMHKYFPIYRYKRVLKGLSLSYKKTFFKLQKAFCVNTSNPDQATFVTFNGTAIYKNISLWYISLVKVISTVYGRDYFFNKRTNKRKKMVHREAQR